MFVYLFDINIFRKRGKVTTNVYRKRIFRWNMTSVCKSFMTETYEIVLTKSLLFSLCSDVVTFYHTFIKKYFFVKMAMPVFNIR